MINEQQKTVIDQLLLAKNYSGIVDIIIRNSDPDNDKHAITLSYMMKFLPSGNLNIGNITKLAEVFDTNETAPSATLEAAYATFCEQTGIVTSPEPRPITAGDIETKKIDGILESVASLPREEQIKNLASTMTLEEIKKNIDLLKDKLQPALQTHKIDHELMNQLSIFKDAYALKQGIKKEFSVWSKEGSLDEVETRKPVRIVEGLDMMEVLHEAYLKTLPSPRDDNSINQLLFLQEHNCLSKREMDAENPETVINNQAEQLVKTIRAKITDKNPIEAGDMWWTDDKEYVFPNGAKIVVSKNDDHATYNFAVEGDKKGMTFILSVHRVDAHGKLLPGAYDLVQFVEGDPVAIISSTEGRTAIKDYDLITSQVKLMRRPNFTVLSNPPAQVATVAKAEETAVAVEAPTAPPVQEVAEAPAPIVAPVAPPAQEVAEAHAALEPVVKTVQAITETAAPEPVISAPSPELPLPMVETSAPEVIAVEAQPVKIRKPRAKKAAEAAPAAPPVIATVKQATDVDETQKTLNEIRDRLQNVDALKAPVSKPKDGSLLSQG